MESGDTFSIKYTGKDFHFFVVISAPEILPDIIWKDYVFLVMLTTKEPWKDNSCILTQEDHPSLTHDTVAAFDSPPSLWVPLRHLQTLKDKKHLFAKGAVTADALQRIRDCYAKSDYQKDTIYQFLWHQGVVS